MTNDELEEAAYREREAEHGRRVQKAINDAIGMTVGWSLGAVTMLALIWGLMGFAAALLAAIACFCTLAALVGYDRLYGIRRALSGRDVL